MRLLFVSHSVPPKGRPLENVGGMQRVALKLHDALQKRAGGDSSLDYESRLLRCSWRWVHLKTPVFLTTTLGRLAWTIRREAVDVVLFSSMVTAALAVPLRGMLRRHGVQTAAIVHGLDVTTPFPPYQWFVPRVFDALDAVLPVSRATKQACRERGATAQQLCVVPNGIDTDRFHRPDSQAEARTQLEAGLEVTPPPPPPEAFLLCSVGRHVRRKGFHWFVDTVMPRLPDNVHYWIAGDGPNTEAIQEAIDARHLHPRVRLLGRITNANLARLYRASDLFIMPNVPVEGDMEGFGVVLLEAAQCGTPAIAARLEGIQDVIAEGENGHLVPPETPEAFVSAIRRYYDAPEQLAPMARRAAAYTTDRFGWASVADTYLSVLRTLDTSGQPPAQVRLAPSEPLPVQPHAA
ncbi:MAG: glycosyltransferase family 4 protein [Salinibacter sp.]